MQQHGENLLPKSIKLAGKKIQLHYPIDQATHYVIFHMFQLSMQFENLLFYKNCGKKIILLLIEKFLLQQLN